MAIAIIPARGGSKRIAHKNIRSFCGQPMLSYAIKAAQQAGCFSHIVVSTDDPNIAQLARQLGAEVPFLRSAHLSDDHTPTTPVIVDAILRLAELNISADHYCCIYATVPLIDTEDLRASHQLLLQNDSPFVYAISEFSFPIQRAVRRDSHGKVSPFWPSEMGKRSQDLEPAFQDAGQFYWGTREGWLNKGAQLNQHALGYEVARYRVIDIDTLNDWRHAELLYQALIQYEH